MSLSNAPSARAQPAETGKVDYEAEIRAIYKQHNPAKLAEVPSLLKKYAGLHRKLLESLRTKYVTSAPGGGNATTSAVSAPTKRRAPEPQKPGDLPVDYDDADDDDDDDDDDKEGTVQGGAGAAAAAATDVHSGKKKTGAAAGAAPATKKGKDDAHDDGDAAAAASSSAAAVQKRRTATVFCCAKCGHDCLELMQPVRMGKLRQRNSDGSAVVPEATLLKSLRAVPGKVNEIRRGPNPNNPARSNELERQFTFLCTHCSAALGYRHKPLTAEAEFCYILRGSIVSSSSQTLAGAGADGGGMNAKLLGAAEECANIVCHVTPGTNKACITAIDDNNEVRQRCASCSFVVLLVGPEEPRRQAPTRPSLAASALSVLPFAEPGTKMLACAGQCFFVFAVRWC